MPLTALTVKMPLASVSVTVRVRVGAGTARQLGRVSKHTR